MPRDHGTRKSRLPEPTEDRAGRCRAARSRIAFHLRDLHTCLILIVCVWPLACWQGPYRDVRDQYFAAYDGENMPGAAVLVIQDGARVYERTFGMANLENHAEVRSETNFRLASVTKQFTAMSIMMLVEDGALALDTSVRSIFPQLPDFADDITVQHLLQHQSGLLAYARLVPDGTEEQVHDADVLDIMAATDGLHFPPGTDYRYSNSGYALLAMIVEVRSGMSFPEFLEQRIFNPLDMSGSVAFVDGVNSVDNRAFGYRVTDGQIEFADQSLFSAVLGDGGIYSSIDDLAKWDQALYTDSLVSSDMMKRALTPGLSNYGFGWRIRDHRGHVQLSHTGSTSGFRNVIQRYPEEQLTVIILTNRAGPNVFGLATSLADRYLQ